MKKTLVLCSGLLVSALGIPAGAQVQVAAAVNVDGFHLAIGNYFQVPQAQIAVCQQNRVPDEEMPVVFFIAQRARVTPQVIIGLRARGMAWMDIAAHYRLDPQVFYVPVKQQVSGPPYGNAYGYYRHHGRGKMRYRLSDADIVNFVNLKFASDYYHRPPEEIIRLRSGGQGFRDIHQHYYRGPQGRNDQGQGRWKGGDRKGYEDEGDGRGQGRWKDKDGRHDDEGDDEGHHGRGHGHEERDDN